MKQTICILSTQVAPRSVSTQSVFVENPATPVLLLKSDMVSLSKSWVNFLSRLGLGTMSSILDTLTLVYAVLTWFTCCRIRELDREQTASLINSDMA